MREWWCSVFLSSQTVAGIVSMIFEYLSLLLMRCVPECFICSCYDVFCVVDYYIWLFVSLLRLFYFECVFFCHNLSYLFIQVISQTLLKLEAEFRPSIQWIQEN